MDCNEVMEQLAEFLDEDVRQELRKAVEEHMTACTDCRFYVNTVRKTIVLYQADRRTEIPIKVSASLQAALAAEYTRGTPPDTRAAD